MLDALARSVGQGLARREARRAEEAGRLNASSSSSVPRFGDVMRDVLDHPSGSEDEEAETEVWSSGEEERERRYLARDAEFDGSFSEDEREFLEELDGDRGASSFGEGGSQEEEGERDAEWEYDEEMGDLSSPPPAPQQQQQQQHKEVVIDPFLLSGEPAGLPADEDDNDDDDKAVEAYFNRLATAEQDISFRSSAIKGNAMLNAAKSLLGYSSVFSADQELEAVEMAMGWARKAYEYLAADQGGRTKKALCAYYCGFAAAMQGEWRICLDGMVEACGLGGGCEEGMWALKWVDWLG